MEDEKEIEMEAEIPDYEGQGTTEEGQTEPGRRVRAVPSLYDVRMWPPGVDKPIRLIVFAATRQSATRKAEIWAVENKRIKTADDIDEIAIRKFGGDVMEMK